MRPFTAAATRDGLTSFVEPACVETVMADGRHLVRFEADGRTGRARWTVAGGAEAGCRVLVAGQRLDDAYVIARLDPAPERIAAANGATARRITDDAGERLDLCDPAGRPVASYRPETGLVTLHAGDQGDLTLAAPAGDIRLVAGGRVVAHGQAGTSLSSAGDLTVQAGLASNRRSRLTLTPDRADLAAGDVAVTSERAEMTTGTARLQAEEVETLAGRIRQRARDMLVTVKGLFRQQAGTVHQHTEDLHRLDSGHLHQQARDAVRLNGRRIHLG